MHVFSELKIYALICSTLLLFLLQLTLKATCANPSYTIWGNDTCMSMRITAILSNGVLVELLVNDGVYGKFLANLKPDGLNISIQNNTLLVKYDARVSGSSLLELMSVNEVSWFKDWPTYLECVAIFVAGLTFLAINILLPKSRDEEVLKIIEDGGNPPKGYCLSEKSLLLLSSRNPDVYERALNMILKGELKVRKGRTGKLNILSRLRKALNYRM